MTKTIDTKPQAKPATSRDALVKPRRPDIALTEQDLEKIAGGVRKAGKGQQE